MVAIVAIVAIVLLAMPKERNKYESVNKDIITVSIQPLKYLAERIVGDDFSIQVIVPSGASPETYELTPNQLIDVDKSKLVATTGLIDFETELTERILTAKTSMVANLSNGIKLIEGSCGHHHHEGHVHSVDPHIWTSPLQLHVMSFNLFNAIALLYPDSVRYKDNYQLLVDDIEELDRVVRQRIEESELKYFFIYHPALTYFARDYNVEQIALEHDGKEPSAERLSSLIKLAREQEIEKVLYQREFSQATVETVAKDIGATPVQIDPLAENVLDNILNITNIITETK